MADLTPMERLQPCLLDRLTDDHPEAKQESRERRVVSLAQYRRGVRRDLQALLNSKARSRSDRIHEFGEVARSVVNFGIPDLCGQTLSGLSITEIERQLVQCIQWFEPRINKDSLTISASGAEDDVGNGVAIEIRGELWAQPAPEELYIKTEVDLETGRCELERRHG